MTSSSFDESPRLDPQEPEPDFRADREPIFNAPWLSVAVTAVIVGGYALQRFLPQDTVVSALAFSPAGLAHGQWPTLVTAIFLHGSWAHALMNGAFALAFATPVARFFGPKVGGAVAFFAFYLLTGVLSNLGYAAFHWGGLEPLVGASGAVSGLMGAAARLIGGQGGPGKLFSRPVIGMGASWFAINALIGVFGGAFLPGTGGASVAWEAHVAGFIAGALLIGPFAWIMRRD